MSLLTWIRDKETLKVLSGWCSDISAGWFGSMFILPIFTDSNPLVLLTVNLPSAILFLTISIWLSKRGKVYE